MGWATSYIQKLLKGEQVQFRPRGPSMKGRIESGQLVTVRPMVDPDELRVGTVVLCKVNGKQYLHLIRAVQGNRYQIANNLGHINGWCNDNCIYGIVVKVED